MKFRLSLVLYILSAFTLFSSSQDDPAFEFSFTWDSRPFVLSITDGDIAQSPTWNPELALPLEISAAVKLAKDSASKNFGPAADTLSVTEITLHYSSNSRRWFYLTSLGIPHAETHAEWKSALSSLRIAVTLDGRVILPHPEE